MLSYDIRRNMINLKAFIGSREIKPSDQMNRVSIISCTDSWLLPLILHRAIKKCMQQDKSLLCSFLNFSDRNSYWILSTRNALPFSK